MDTRTGDLYTEEEMRELMKAFSTEPSDPSEFVRIDPTEATQKQLQQSHVKLKDHRSKLGKQLTKERRIRNFNTRRK